MWLKCTKLEVVRCHDLKPNENEKIPKVTFEVVRKCHEIDPACGTWPWLIKLVRSRNSANVNRIWARRLAKLIDEYSLRSPNICSPVNVQRAKQIVVRSFCFVCLFLCCYVFRNKRKFEIFKERNALRFFRYFSSYCFFLCLVKWLNNKSQ